MGELIQLKGKPWLYPYNRRLRHLSSIVIRNLSRPDQPSSRARAGFVDDEGLPQTLQSPEKFLAQKELRNLEHTRSSTDLVLRALKENVNKENTPSYLTTPKRPSSKRLRRRSTIDWANTSPSIRQRRLEEDQRMRLMDAFFSLHIEVEEQPIYISEILTKTINPTFQDFTLADQPVHVTREDVVTLKIWAKEVANTQFQLHMEVQLNLQCLQYIGKSLDSITYSLPRNTVLFTLVDGLYTLPSTLNIDSTDNNLLTGQNISSGARVFPTSSYDALMRLSTLDVLVQDALSTLTSITTDLKDLLESQKYDNQIILSVGPANQRLTTVTQTTDLERKRLLILRKRRDNLAQSIAKRKTAMTVDIKERETHKAEMRNTLPAMNAQKSEIQTLQDATLAQRRRICEDIQRIFPIEPDRNGTFAGRPLAFAICGLPLPNTHELDDAADDSGASTAAALGHVAQVLTVLSAYLRKPLPYPIDFRGSSSVVTDVLSSGAQARVAYPLYSRGVARFRFEYAVFLINKNIEVLSIHIGLKCTDLRLTLPNLKYLLYVCSAGQGEIPLRKAGGMRAFLRGNTMGSLTSSRRSSDASSTGSGTNGGGQNEVLSGNKLGGGYKSSGLRNSSVN